MTELAGKTAFVTGVRGFLGRRVCELLQARGLDELVVTRRAEVNLTVQATTHAYVTEQRPDVIVHLAAEVGDIEANGSHPGRYFFANMAMGLHLIEAAREVGVGKFVQVGTCSFPKHPRAVS